MFEFKDPDGNKFEIVEGMSKEDLAQLRHLCLVLVENARKELGK